MDKSLPAFDASDNLTGKCPDCSVEVGTIFDGHDCTIEIKQIYANEAIAQQALAEYTQKARQVESEPCQIHSSITAIENGVQLQASFEFSCQAEKVIFQFKTR